MSSTATTKLGLFKAVINSGEPFRVSDFNSNMDKIDASSGAFICTSTTRPGNPFDGQLIKETDTKCIRIWNAGTNEWILLGSGKDEAQVTYNTGWTWTSSTAVIPTVKLRNGTVYCQGATRRSSGTTESAFTVPAGFRPEFAVTYVPYAVNGGNAVARMFRITFDPTGDVTITSASNGTQPVWDSSTWFSVTGVWPVGDR